MFGGEEALSKHPEIAAVTKSSHRLLPMFIRNRRSQPKLNTLSDPL
jgi:hypothetical protein